jgi:hypothetical protein
MQDRKKYKIGDVISSLDELAEQEFVFVNEKIYHRGFFGSWQFRFCMAKVQNGNVRKAVKISSKKKTQNDFERDEN